MSIAPDDAAEDDVTIPSDEVLYRRIASESPNLVTRDRVTGARRPASGAFKPDSDGVSVFRNSLLEINNLTVKDVYDSGAGELAVSLLVAKVRELALGIVADPDPTDAPPDPVLVAHALVKFPRLSKNQRLRVQRGLASAATFVE